MVWVYKLFSLRHSCRLVRHVVQLNHTTTFSGTSVEQQVFCSGETHRYLKPLYLPDYRVLKQVYVLAD